MSNVDSMVNIMSKAANLTLDVANTALSVVSMLITPIDGDPVSTAWKEAIKNDQVNVFSCSKDEMKEIIKAFKEQGVTYKIYGDMIFTLKADEERVNKILEDTSRGVISTEEALGTECEKGFVEVTVKDLPQALQFKKRLDQNEVPYTINKVGVDGEYKVIVPDTYKDKLDRIKLDVAIDSVGEYGEVLKRELLLEDSYKREMFIKLGDTESNQTVYVVDEDGTLIQSDKNFISIEKDGIEISTTRKTQNIDEYGRAFIEMKLPTVLKQEELKDFYNATDKRAYLLERRRNQGIGVLTADEEEMFLKREKERLLIAQKLGEMHPSEVVADMNDYNCEQPLVLFSEARIQNYEMEHDMAQIGQVGGEFLNDALMHYKGYMVFDSEVDFSELAKLEKNIFDEELVEERMLGLDLSELFKDMQNIDEAEL